MVHKKRMEFYGIVFILAVVISDSKLCENLFYKNCEKYQNLEMSTYSQHYDVPRLVFLHDLVTGNPAFSDSWVSELAGRTVKKKRF